MRRLRGAPEQVVWEDERWVLKHSGSRRAAVVVVLQAATHVDFGQFDDELASEHGRISFRLVRIIERLEHIAGCHVLR